MEGNYMSETSPIHDHDLLVRLDTKLEIMLKQQAEFIDRYESRHSILIERVTALENKDSRDSEKVQSITKDVQRSLANHERINALEGELDTMKKFKDREWQIWIIIVGTAIGTLWNLFIK